VKNGLKFTWKFNQVRLELLIKKTRETLTIYMTVTNGTNTHNYNFFFDLDSDSE